MPPRNFTISRTSQRYRKRRWSKAAAGPEPSWEVYARLIDLDIARNDYAGAETLMEQAMRRFEDSPVLLPKRIEILKGAGPGGRRQGADAQMQEL